MSDTVESTATELVAYESPPSPTLFKSEDPVEIVAQATKTANELERVVRAKKLVVKIGHGEHVRVEGWTLLGTMLGVFPICVWTRKLDDGWEARVEARTLGGQIVGAAEAQCLRSEDQWSYEPKDKYGKPLKARDDYALRSMAQTRATSKALRQPLGFVMTLAGFDATPAEEMPRQDPAQVAPGVVADALPQPEPEPSSQAITDAQKRKLNVVIAKLVDKGWVTKEQLIASTGRTPVRADDGKYHFSKVRDSLTITEASELIDRLERYEREKEAEMRTNPDTPFT